MNVFNNLIAIFLISMNAFQAHSASSQSLKFSELIPVSEKPKGINQGGVYSLKKNPEQKVFVKTLVKDDPENNALILSYLTSRLLSLISPGQGPIIVPVLGGKTPMIASFDIPTFEHAGSDQGKYFALLNLALDLMDITDRHGGNLGTAMVNGKRDAVIVDVDMYGSFKSSWLDTTFYKHLEKQQVLSALKVISSFSDESVANVFYIAVHELEKEMFFGTSLKLHFPVDFIFHNVILRKHQMEWTLRHFDSMFGIIHKTLNASALKEIDIQDDKYGLFLKAAVHDNNLEMFKVLLVHGAKDPDGRALEAVVDNNNLEMFNALLAHGAQDPYGWALRAAADNNNLEMVNALLAHGAKDPSDYALRVAVRNKNLEMLNALLAHGAQDPDGRALEAAAESDNLQMVDALLAHGAEDSSGYALRAAVRNKNLEMVNALLANGAQDPGGIALRAAADNNNLQMVDALLAHGAQDPYGQALKAARHNKRHEMIKALEAIQK